MIKVSSLSIRGRIILYIVLFLTFFGGIAYVTQHFLSKSKKSETLSKNALLIKAELQHLKIIENEVLTEDVVNDTFYNEGNTANLLNFYNSYQHVFSHINQSFSPDQQEVIDSSNVDKLVYLLADYKTSFDSLITILRVKGFRDFGLIGEFRSSVHDAEGYITELGNDEFYKYLLLLRRHEKDFLLRKDSKYVDQFMNTFGAFITELESYSDVELSENTISLISNYQRDFTKLVDIQTSISSDKQGILRELEQRYGAIFPVLNQIINTTEIYRKRMLNNLTSSLVILLVSAAALVIILMSRLSVIITKPIKSLHNRLLQLSTGDISGQHINIKGKNEIVRMGNALNVLIDGLRNTINFANDIRNGNYESEFKPLSEKDTLGKSLLEMRDNLVKAAKDAEEQRKLEYQQNWINSGSAKFADILNQQYSDTSEFAFHIISNLVKYLEANQGGMFMINDEEPDDVHLELKSAFAYNRRKFMQKRIEMGEGFVGTSVLEKSIIYRTEIPDDYIFITSGLGEANPHVLLIVPLVLEDNIYGAIEIASFREFKPYELEFIKKISETIASTISAVKNKERTEKLLAQTKDQSEQIAQTEEEMRQNMEELQATQEEMARKQKELEQQKILSDHLLDSIPLPVYVKDENRKYYLINEETSALMDVPKGEIIGKTEEELIKDKASVELAKESDLLVLNSKQKTELPEQKIKLNNGVERVYKTFKVPFVNNITDKTNLLGISVEVTDTNCKEQLIKAQRQIEDLKKELEKFTAAS